MKKAKKLHIYKGLFFEYLACFVLFMKGYKILKRDFRVKNMAQLDIIGQQKRDEIIIFEVKFRKKSENLYRALSQGQKRRIQNNAIKLGRVYNTKIRVDLVCFSLDFPFFIHKKNILN